jgi:dTMP kinase
MERKRGKFIVFDGLDCSGKGSQAKKLHNYLFDKDKRNHVLLTREPYYSVYYDEIRKILKESKNPRDNAERLAELFVADRKEHVWFIERDLAAGIYVVCDRYKYSTLAYQQTQGVSLQRLIVMHEGVLVPDLVIILDVPAEVAIKRLAFDKGREYKEVFEEREFQEQLRNNFLALPNQLLEENIVIIDGDRSFEEVFEDIKNEVNKILAA